MGRRQVLKFVSHSATVLQIAVSHGWFPGARYTNLRDVKRYKRLGFLDIVWKSYDFQHHLEAATFTRPTITVARDLEDKRDLRSVVDQAYRLLEYAKHVVIVPKDRLLESRLSKDIPAEFLLGYSVPTRYGGTKIPPAAFQRPVHLLGGRPDVQRRLADVMPVFSIDTNRFTLDAAYGDYFDGQTFRPHPVGGYRACLIDSIKNISLLWSTYQASRCDQNVRRT